MIDEVISRVLFYILNVFIPFISAKPVVEAIENCLELHYLNLEGNTLGVDAAKEIARALENHPEFKRALWKDMFTGRMKTEIPKALVFIHSNIYLVNMLTCPHIF